MGFAPGCGSLPAQTIYRRGICADGSGSINGTPSGVTDNFIRCNRETEREPAAHCACWHGGQRVISSLLLLTFLSRKGYYYVKIDICLSLHNSSLFYQA